MRTKWQGVLGLCVVLVCLQGCSSSGSGSGSMPPPVVAVSISPQSTMVFSTQSVQLTATDSEGVADLTWGVTSMDTTAPAATVDATGNFTAPTVTQNETYTVTVTSMKDSTKTAATTVTVMAPGQVAATIQPQVAQYSVVAPAGTNVMVQFSTDTSYGLKTWAQAAPTSGGTVSLLVAGMLANTAYHMRAVVQATDGTMATDVDHVFTTTAVPVAQQPKLTVTTAPGASPQSGVEILDLATGYPGSSLAVVDLQGRLLWSYPWQGTISDLLQGVHLLPNGHLLMDISETSDEPVAKPAVAGTIQVLREIDLTGATIREESLDALNAALPAAGMNFTVLTFHHDVIQLPNGHWIALGSILQPCTGMPYVCPTYPNLLGDVIIDLAPQTDGTFLPVWSWNTFDHLDTSRALEGYPDWTHSNALLYSADDGNLLLSMRHQSWIIKIDYANGKGAGDILWKLGEGGDFTLMGGTDPQDWFYAEHGPSFVSTNTTGKFQLAVMDNGNVRVYPTGQTCASVGEPTCPYSTSEVYEIDETAKTATILTKYGPGEFSLWGGNSEQLTNGNLESDFNAGAPAGLSDIFETTQGTSPEVVWQLRTLGQNAYRGFRLPSLYPGVQW